MMIEMKVKMISLYNTFYNQLIKLDKKTKIYPGHDYLTTNLQFTLSLEPNNKNAYDLLQKSKIENFSTSFISCLETEFEVNVFFRLKEKSIKESIYKDPSILLLFLSDFLLAQGIDLKKLLNKKLNIS